MANVYSVLSMSSVATVLMAGNVQAQSIPPEGPRLRYIHRHAHSSPQADADRHRQRVCPREAHAISSSVSRLR
jgi:hypothetical protein